MNKLSQEQWEERKAKVLSKMNRHMSHSVTDVMYRTGLHRDAVYKVLDELIEEGKVVEVQEGKGYFRHSEWMLKGK